MQKKISIIVPALNDLCSFRLQIKALKSQSVEPHEIIIVDSSSDEKIYDEIKSFKYQHSIKYFRAGRASKFDRYLELIFKNMSFLNKFFRIKTSRMYPSEATNYGVDQASGDILGLIDMSTIPESNWLENSLKLFSDSTEVVFGSTKYESSTFIQKCIHLSTFGYIPQESNPGTLILRSAYIKHRMREGVRAGADLEWRERIKKNCSWRSDDKYNLKYRALPNSIYKFCRKMFIYQMHSAFLKIQTNTKDTVAFFSLVLLTLVISRWNYLVGWESSFYIPHVTKIFLLILNIFLLQLIVFRRLGFAFMQKLSIPSLNSLLVFILIFTTFLISYRWNAIIAEWIESSRFYIPHLTKIYFGVLMTILLTYRGLYFPIKRGASLGELLPIKFIAIGSVGVLGDLAKLPGFVIGSIASLFLLLKRK